MGCSESIVTIQVLSRDISVFHRIETVYSRADRYVGLHDLHACR